MAVSTSETLVNFYQTTWYNISDKSPSNSPPREPKISSIILLIRKAPNAT
jgi:hypothetical protein